MSFGTRDSVKRRSSVSEFLHKLEPKKLLTFDCKKKLKSFVQNLRESHSATCYWDSVHQARKPRQWPAPQPRLSITVGPEERGQLPWFSKSTISGGGGSSVLSVEPEKQYLPESAVILGIPGARQQRGLLFDGEKRPFGPSITSTTVSTLQSEW